MKTVKTSLLFLIISINLSATEGMWIPGMIQQMVADNMTTLGMKITAEDLYSINKSCIRDAVVHFDGGCTGVLVSDQGLLLTNHHCGYSSIQQHSSLEHNYLDKGFWAMSQNEELSNPNLDASVIKEIRDVSTEVLANIPANATEKQRELLIKQYIDAIVAKATENTHYLAYVKPFYYGNQYLLFITEVFDDVRLVGAPPSSIGKFGFDTDNWVWPRHTGDFSVFRVYAGKDNKPAKYSADNVPYKPAYYLPVSLSGVEQNDFTLVYGFPGRTDNYISSEAVKQNLEVINPIRLSMREASLSVIDKAMRENELTRIQYAAKQSRISNAYKKWIGQSKGLIRLHAIDKKDSLEQVFQTRVETNENWKKSYGSLLLDLQSVQMQSLPYNVGREYFVEFFYMGPEVLRFSATFGELANMSLDKSKTQADAESWLESKTKDLGYFKNYNAQVDKDIMKKQLAIARADVLEKLGFDIAPDAAKFGSLDAYVEDLYAKSIFTNEDRFKSFVAGYKTSKAKQIERDPAYVLAMRVQQMYETKAKKQLISVNAKSDSLMRHWMDAQMAVIPEKTYYPDANGTLRISFGKVEGYAPFDGAEYDYYTTLDGVMEKEDATNEEFHVPARLKELYNKKDFGRYAHSTGEMRVAFIASNHTSGGNSGSPVINAEGELIGLNFDRTWESTMSDIMFNPVICRNITVDIRYVLFIMDKYAGAKHLVDEMKLMN